MYGLWVITGMGYGHRNFLSTKLVDSKCYRLSQVMGYHSMGYLRFDCIRTLVIRTLYETLAIRTSAIGTDFQNTK